MQEAVFGPAGQYYNVEGTVAAELLPQMAQYKQMDVWAALQYSWMADQHFTEVSMEIPVLLQQSYQDC